MTWKTLPVPRGRSRKFVAVAAMALGTMVATGATAFAACCGGNCPEAGGGTATVGTGYGDGWYGEAGYGEGWYGEAGYGEGWYDDAGYGEGWYDDAEESEAEYSKVSHQ